MEKAGGTFNNHSGLASRRVICRTALHKTAEIFTFTYSGNGFVVWVDVGCVGMNSTIQKEHSNMLHYYLNAVRSCRSLAGSSMEQYVFPK